MTTRRLALIALVTMLAVPAALASGFHIYEQGAKASGQAVAFLARADDGSAAYYNPAAVAKFDGMQVDFGVSFVFLGNSKLNSSAETISNGNPLYGTTGLFTDGEYKMRDHTPTPIHIGIGQRFKNSPFAWSFAVTNPFGLVTDWDPTYVGRYAALRTDLRTFDYQLNGAMDFGGGWSGSVGVNYLTVDLRSFSKLIRVPVIVPPPTFPVTTYAADADVSSDLTGTGNEFGWNAAIHYRNPQFAFGATYRSGFNVKLDGTATFGVVSVVSRPGIPVPGEAFAPSVAAAFPTGPGGGELRLPSMYGAGFAYTGLKNWEFELDITRIEWSKFDEIPVTFENAIGKSVANPAGTTTSIVPENWESTTAYRFGTQFAINDNNHLRFGAYVESNPIPKATLRPSIPDGERTGVTAGYGLKLGKFTIDAYYLHIMVKDTTIDVTDTTAVAAQVAQQVPAVTTNNAAEIGRTGTYKSTIDLAGFTIGYKF